VGSIRTHWTGENIRMTQMIIYTGTPGDKTRIEMHWFDENNVPMRTLIDVEILDLDKPRTLRVKVNRHEVLCTTVSYPLEIE